MNIRSQLPLPLRSRLDSLGRFVHVIVAASEDEDRLPKSRRMPKAAKDELSLLVFVFSLRHLLKEGTRAATLAADEIEKLGVPGFQIGSQEFQKGNDNVLRGERLANELWDQIADNRIKRMMDSQDTITGVIQKLHEIYKTPEVLDRYGPAQ